MPRAGGYERIGRGIFRGPADHRVQVSFRGKKKERRFPLDASLRQMKDWQDEQRPKLRRGRVIFEGPSGSLAADVRTYLPTVKHLVSWKSKRSELHAWTALYGKRDRRDIGHHEVKLAIARWTAAGAAPKTIRNRLVALASLYRTLDADPAEPHVLPPTPCDGVTIHVPKKRPIYVSAATVKRVEKALRAQEKAGRLRDQCTRARFMVLASTGVRPSQLMRAVRVDVDLRRRTWLLAGAKGGEPIAFWLNDDMLAAWRLFVKAEAWGKYDTRSFARTLRSSGWPPLVRPYNVRHAIGQDLSERGEDLQDIADWLGDDPATVRKHYVPVITSRLAAMARRIDGRLGWGRTKKVPQLVPQNGRKNPSKVVETRRFQPSARTNKSGRLLAKAAR
jgi:integrase